MAQKECVDSSFSQVQNFSSDSLPLSIFGNVDDIINTNSVFLSREKVQTLMG